MKTFVAITCFYLLLLLLFMSGCSQTSDTATFVKADPESGSRIFAIDARRTEITVFFDNPPKDLTVKAETPIYEWYLKNKVLTVITTCPARRQITVELRWASGFKTLTYRCPNN